MKTVQSTLVKELRTRTGAGFLDCSNALKQTDGDFEAAIELLKKAGYVIAAKKASRLAVEGSILLECDDHGRHGVMVEINSETDFMAKDPEFREFCDTVVQALIAREAFQDVEVLRQAFEGERTALVSRTGENLNIRRVAHVSGERVAAYSHGNGRMGVLVAASGKGELSALKAVAMHIAAANPMAISSEEIQPEALIGLADDSNIESVRAAHALLSQPLVTDPSLTVQQYLSLNGLTVTAFHRFELGEGLDKPTTNFAAEVAAAQNA